MLIMAILGVCIWMLYKLFIGIPPAAAPRVTYGNSPEPAPRVTYGRSAASEKARVTARMVAEMPIASHTT